MTSSHNIDQGKNVQEFCRGDNIQTERHGQIVVSFFSGKICMYTHKLFIQYTRQTVAQFYIAYVFVYLSI